MSKETVHFIGVGGVGMSGIARVAHDQGMAVSGSDLKESRYTKQLKAAGIDVPDSCRLLIVDVKRDINHVFARVEQLMPVIPLLRAANVDEAIEWALILERGLSHTAGHRRCSCHQ